MNACEHEQDVNLFLDGELEGERLRTFEAHLEGCAPCREQVEHWRQVREALGSLTRGVSLSQIGWARLHDRLSARMREARLAEIRRMAEGFAAMAAAVLLACFLWQGVWTAATPAMNDPLADAAWEQALVNEAANDEADEDLQLARWLAYDLSPRRHR